MSDARRLRAPRDDGAVVAEPPLTEMGRLLAENRQRFAGQTLTILGRPWADLRRDAARATRNAADAYLQAAGEPVPAGDASSLLLAGHQPELFHPGVWAKNFALCGLARRHDMTPINLVVDNDTAKATALRVPAPGAVESEWPHAAAVPFDAWGGDVPYEERAVRDEALFASLPDRAAAMTRGWPFTPLLESFWRDALRQAVRTSLLGERFVAARRARERTWGCHNREVPVSAICQTEPFAWFVCHLLGELPRFHAIYNACVHDYRKRHGIRSRNHPVPDLVQEGNWLEAPFWAWRSGQQRRGRLLVRRGESDLELRAGAERWPTVPCQPKAWRMLERTGYKVRSRALTNTLFARWFVADLFLHGLGGGKYDELTDSIARQFYGIEPPTFAVLSATLRLPLPTHPDTPADCRRLAGELRDLQWNPQRQAMDDVRFQDLADLKATWIARQTATSAERRERYRTLRAATEQMRALLDGREDELRQRLARCERAVRATAVLRRRDYAFCLYPTEQLRSFCSSFL